MTSIAKLVGVAASILTIAVFFMLAPMIGGSFENSGPTLAADSDWNESYNADIPTGADFWTDNASFITIVVIAIMAGLIITVFTKMQKGA